MRKFIKELRNQKTHQKPNILNYNLSESAAVRLFNIEELLIIILGYVVELCHTPAEYAIRQEQLGKDIRSLVRCRQVCHRWDNIISREKQFQMKTFMRVDPNWPWDHPNPALLTNGPAFDINIGVPLRQELFEINDHLRPDILRRTLFDTMSYLHKTFPQAHDGLSKGPNCHRIVNWRNMALSIHGLPWTSYHLRLYQRRVLSHVPIYLFNVGHYETMNPTQIIGPASLVGLTLALCRRLAIRFRDHHNDWQNYDLRDALGINEEFDESRRRLDIFITQVLSGDDQYHWRMVRSSSKAIE